MVTHQRSLLPSPQPPLPAASRRGTSLQTQRARRNRAGGVPPGSRIAVCRRRSLPPRGGGAAWPP